MPLTLVELWHLDRPQLLAHRQNTHWRVTAPTGPAVLRRHAPRTTPDDVTYQHAVGDHLRSAGWPVAVVLAGPQYLAGHWWELHTLLPGTPRADTPEEDRRRGHLLADLHATLATLELGPRAGWSAVHEVLADERLDHGLRWLEQVLPDQARVLHWHRDRALEQFSVLDATKAPWSVVHGDVALQNLLYDGERLTGLLDLEATHRDLRVAEFALAWRGRRDALVHGYAERRPLLDVEWALLTPSLWAWVFLGVADEVHAMRVSGAVLHGFDWPVRILLRRSPLMGSATADYPG